MDNKLTKLAKLKQETDKQLKKITIYCLILFVFVTLCQIGINICGRYDEDIGIYVFTGITICLSGVKLYYIHKSKDSKQFSSQLKNAIIDGIKCKESIKLNKDEKNKLQHDYNCKHGYLTFITEPEINTDIIDGNSHSSS